MSFTSEGFCYAIIDRKMGEVVTDLQSNPVTAREILNRIVRRNVFGYRSISDNDRGSFYESIKR